MLELVEASGLITLLRPSDVHQQAQMYRRMVWEFKLVGAEAKKSPRTVEFLVDATEAVLKQYFTPLTARNIAASPKNYSISSKKTEIRSSRIQK